MVEILLYHFVFLPDTDSIPELSALNVYINYCYFLYTTNHALMSCYGSIEVKLLAIIGYWLLIQ